MDLSLWACELRRGPSRSCREYEAAPCISIDPNVNVMGDPTLQVNKCACLYTNSILLSGCVITMQHVSFRGSIAVQCCATKGFCCMYCNDSGLSLIGHLQNAILLSDQVS